MLIPCIDLMDGKAVQLVRGRKKALEADPFEMLAKFRGFPAIQVIDLDAAMGNGNNYKILKRLCRQAPCRVGGGVRTLERVRELAELGAKKIIIGTAAFREGEIDRSFLSAARRGAGVNVCLGTDSLATVRKAPRERIELDLFEEMRELAQREPWLGPKRILEMATVNGARALGFGGQVGEISKRAFADLVAIPYAGPQAEVWEAVVNHCGPVVASMIDGEWVFGQKGS